MRTIKFSTPLQDKKYFNNVKRLLNWYSIFCDYVHTEIGMLRAFLYQFDLNTFWALSDAAGNFLYM